MFKNRFILVIGVLSLLLVSIAAMRPFSNASVSRPVGASDFYQRHPDWKSPVVNPAIPVNGATELSDFYQRHPDWNTLAVNPFIPVNGATELSDYYQRHPELSRPTVASVDLSDYFMRHPELRGK